MKQIDLIFSELLQYYEEEAFIDAIDQRKVYGMEAIEIANRLHIARNNASALLNKLVDEQKIVKITGRPVHFLPRQPLEETLRHVLDKSEFTYEELKRLLVAAQDPFLKFVGHDGTLKSAIDQAKAAIMYPPNGLNTMIVGKTGSGVTHFVETMYAYAKIQKDLNEQEYPYQYLNCADYNNPRQLLYKIFGDADQEHGGLLEKANKGMLFLDNVYLLPKEVKERLFQFLDKGEFCRIGDSENIRKAKVLVVVSSLKDHHTLDDAQMRRFPITIQLPELSEWRVDERIRLIEHYFSIEASRIMRVVKVTSEVVRALCIYECLGNLSQLESDIKKICAKAFLEQLHQNSDVLEIEFSYLPAYIKDFVISGKKIDTRYREYLKAFDNNLIIEADKNHQVNVVAQNSIYADVLNISEAMHKKGAQREEIDSAVKKHVEDYINHFLARFDDYRSVQKELYRSLNKEIVDFTVSIAEEASKELNRNMNSNLIYVLAFHINYLILRSKAKATEEKAEYPFGVDANSKEYQVAKMITRKISKHFETDIQDQEIGFIALLLESEGTLSKKDETANVLIVAHGDKTATSMANVANQLMKTNIVYGVDMPLELGMDDVYREVVSIANAIRNNAGILLMVDMGSLAQIGKQVAEETGIMVKSVERVSTIYVLEAVRRILYKNETLEEIQTGIMELQTLPYYVNGEVMQKPLCIVTTCSTGIGTSIMLQKKIEERLVNKKITSIKVIPIGYADIRSGSAEFENIRRKYEIIACVGNINPRITETFFDLTSIVRETKNYMFDKFLDNYVDVSKNDPYIELESILNENVYYFNVKRSIPYFRNFFEAIRKDGYVLSNDAIIKCALHISYMLERLILKQMAVFSESLNEYIKENRDLYTMLYEYLKPFEGAFQIEITEDEVCFLCEVFKNIDQL